MKIATQQPLKRGSIDKSGKGPRTVLMKDCP